MRIILIIVLCLMISGCAHISKDGRTFYGWGKSAKDAEGNPYVTESTPPITLPKVEI